MSLNIARHPITHFGLLVVLVCAKADAHKGSPWHGNNISAALGVNTLRLELPPGQSSGRFRVSYPVQPNKLDYAVGDTGTVIVVSDEKLRATGFVTEKNAVLAQETNTYDPATPFSTEFEIDKTGYYHVLFGPGPNTSILVLEPSLTVNITPVSAGAKAGPFLAPATSGDFHIIKHPAMGLKQFSGWFAVFFDEYRSIYEQSGVSSARELQLEGQRSVAFAKSLADLGYTAFNGFTAPTKTVTGPFLGHVNGLGVEAVDTVFLAPGEYDFSYSPSKAPWSIVRTREVVLQVWKDSTLDKGYGTESDVLARSEIQANTQTDFTLSFSVKEAGYYHLSYGPGEGGFIFHMTNDDDLPTVIVARSGEAKDHTKLVAVNSSLVGSRPLELGGLWQVFFPCKLVQSKTTSRGLFKGTAIPISNVTAASVARLGSAIMHPIMVEQMRSRLQSQAKELDKLRQAVK